MVTKELMTVQVQIVYAADRTNYSTGQLDDLRIALRAKMRSKLAGMLRAVNKELLEDEDLDFALNATVEPV